MHYTSRIFLGTAMLISLVTWVARTTDSFDGGLLAAFCAAIAFLTCNVIWTTVWYRDLFTRTNVQTRLPIFNGEMRLIDSSNQLLLGRKAVACMPAADILVSILLLHFSKQLSKSYCPLIRPCDIVCGFDVLCDMTCCIFMTCDMTCGFVMPCDICNCLLKP